MNHGHDHQNHHGSMVASTNPIMNHAQHIIQPQINTSSMHSGHGSHTKDMMMMPMTFHAGIKEQILFNGWNTETIGAFIGSWFIIFFVAILYEGLKTIRDHLAKSEARRHYAEKHPQQSPLVTEHGQQYDNSNTNDTVPRVRTKRARLLSSYHIIQTLLHILQMGISYLLMLVAMTFNIYLFLAIILGAGLGHFLFGWRRSSIIDYNEHCH